MSTNAGAGSASHDGTGRRFAEAAEALAAQLTAGGVGELFTMPGDAFPVLEAVARAHERSDPAPRIITCLHEIIAVAAAHGHHMVSRTPQAVLLHVDVGLQMAGGMLHNAQRARAGMLLLGGRTPASWDAARPGARVIDMHWIQDRRDVGAPVRDYVKWSYDAQRAEPLPQVIARALRIAASEPAGPVYVSLLREMLMEPLETHPPDPRRHPAPAAAVPAPEVLDTLADWICAAERPLVLAGHSGRDPAAFHALGRFAEEAAVPVFSRGARANLSSDCPMYLGTDFAAALAEADLVLLLDVDVPWTPAFHRLREDARIVSLDIDPLKLEMGLWSFPADLVAQVSTAATLPVLLELVRDRRTASQASRAQARRERITDRHHARRAALQAGSGPRSGPLQPRDVAGAVAELLDEDAIVVDDSTTAIAANAEILPTRLPASYFQPMGSSMGWGAGASLGAKLAAPDRTVVSLNAEGNFFSGAPEAALWTAARESAPFLTVVYNNAQYAAIKLGVQHAYPDGALLRSGTALELEKLPDIAGLARSAGAHAERVEDGAQLTDALQRGLEAVQGGQCAVVDVAVAGP